MELEKFAGFLRSDIGRCIEVIDPGISRLLPGFRYKIRSLPAPDLIELEGVATYWTYSTGSFVFSDEKNGEPQFPFKTLTKGSVVRVNRNYQSFKEGQTSVVEEVVDNYRVKLKGCLPGGFILVNDLEGEYDLDKIRMISSEELQLLLGLQALKSVPVPGAPATFGKVLSSIGCFQKDRNILYGEKNNEVPLAFSVLRNSSEEIPKICLSFRHIEVAVETKDFAILKKISERKVRDFYPELTLDSLMLHFSKSNYLKIRGIDHRFIYKDFITTDDIPPLPF